MCASHGKIRIKNGRLCIPFYLDNLKACSICTKKFKLIDPVLYPSIHPVVHVEVVAKSLSSSSVQRNHSRSSANKILSRTNEGYSFHQDARRLLIVHMYNKLSREILNIKPGHKPLLLEHFAQRTTLKLCNQNETKSQNMPNFLRIFVNQNSQNN